jgi:sugar transferase EpsL
MKRVLDIIISMFLLGLFLVPGICIAILLKVVYGKVIFVQTRPGLHTKPFFMYKFRTMHNGFSEDEKSRVTRIGHILRKTSLDEIPQLINVLKGEMSMVGPRPLLMEYIAEPNPVVEYRHTVKPGLTGLVQIKGRNSLSWKEKFELDAYYIQNRTLFMDLQILFITIFKMVSFDAAETQIPEKYKRDCI